MKKPAHLDEVVLQPGQWWFGGGATRLRTVLGSCVAVTLWHPKWRIGGMCHYMLPERGNAPLDVPLVAERDRHAGRIDARGDDGRYGDEALAQLVREVERDGGAAGEYEAKLFGGGRMFRAARPASGGDTLQVPGRNVQAGRELLLRHGFACKAEHVGGYGHREVILDLPNGHVWVRHTPLRDAQRPVSALGELT
jgi:chemotaxis protein CheD